MFLDERLDKIMELLNKNKKVKVNELSQIFPREKIITSKPGPAAYILSEEEWHASQKKFEKSLEHEGSDQGSR